MKAKASTAPRAALRSTLRLATIALGACVTTPLAAQADAAAPGLARYAAGAFDAAEPLLRRALAAPDVAPGPLLFALGTCAYRLDRLPDALLAYRQAALRMPRDAELAFNIAWVERKLGAERPAPSPLGALLAPLQRFTTRELLLASVLLQTVGLCGALWATSAADSHPRGGRRLRWVRRRQALRALLLATAAVGLLLAGQVAHATWLRAPEAIVLAPRVALRADPSADAPATAEAHAGDTVVVDEVGDAWLHVTHAAGAGWVERPLAGIID